jgi:hypothetical protein
MKDTSGTDDWRSLCELASKETNPQELLELITRINRALEECHRSRRQAEQVSLGASSATFHDPFLKRKIFWATEVGSQQPKLQDFVVQ